jgi:predicted nucleic acid-binding protein
MPSEKRRFIDTNIFLRFLTAEIPEQAQRCAALIQRIRDGVETVEVSSLAAAEIVWTLERFYKLSKEQVASKVSSLLKLKGLRIANKAIFLEALSLFTEKNISFTDAYIAAQMKRANQNEIYSYDRDFDRIEQIKRLEP